MDARYPIGRFQPSSEVTPAHRERWIQDIETAPAILSRAVADLTDPQLDTPYREGGWTVRQVVHHVADGHMNSFIRFKLALTEVEPTIKPFEENAWAELPDSRKTPVEPSLQIIEALHDRWSIVLRSMSPEQFARVWRHPEQGLRTLELALAVYAWHGRHHAAHITGLRQRMGW